MAEPRPEQAQEWHDDGLAETVTALEHDGGVLSFRGWTVRYDLTSDEAGLNEHMPGEFDMTAIARRYDIIARVWEGVPEPFRKVVLYHEIQEATIALGDADDYLIGGRQRGRMTPADAHKLTVPLHISFARESLSPDIFESFMQWDDALPKGRVY